MNSGPDSMSEGRNLPRGIRAMVVARRRLESKNVGLSGGGERSRAVDTKNIA